jgi:hypothetical protein
MRSKAVVAFCFLVGCAATPLNPGAGQIRLTNTEPGKQCRYLGETTGRQGGWWTGAFTSNESLEEGARNDLKNEAASLGANVVHLVSSQTGTSASGGGGWGGGGGGSQTTLVTYVGAAYRCPSTDGPER